LSSLVSGYIEANVGGALSNVVCLFGECGALIDEFLHKNDDYQVNEVIVEISMG
jgi:hypothetical protein